MSINQSCKKAEQLKLEKSNISREKSTELKYNKLLYQTPIPSAWYDDDLKQVLDERFYNEGAKLSDKYFAMQHLDSKVTNQLSKEDAKSLRYEVIRAKKLREQEAK